MKRFLILAALLLVVSCSKDSILPEGEPIDDMQSITLSVSTGSVGTRVTVDGTTSSDELWNFVWEEDDALSGWDNECDEVNKFVMVKHDAEESTFTGSVSSEATSMRLIYPYETGKRSGNYYTLDISEQDGALSKVYMMSDLISVDGSTETMPEMKHLGGFIRLTVELENAIADATYEITEVKVGGVPTQLDALMTEEDFLGETTTFYDGMTSDGTITATLSNTTFDSDNELEVRLNTLPFTYVVGDELTFDIKFEVNGTEYTSHFVKTNTSGSDIPFERAKFNYTTIILDGIQTQITGCKINGWGEGNGDGEDLNAEPFE